MKKLFFILSFFILKNIGNAQTCCSGGVPLSSNLGLPAGEKGVIQMALTYDLNVLETLKTGNQTLEDDSRSRKTHSTILEKGFLTKTLLDFKVLIFNNLKGYIGNKGII